MFKGKIKAHYFFVDESGDPIFYNKYGQCIVGKEGCSKILLIGFVKTENPKLLRKTVFSLREEISRDKYLEKIPSMKKTLRTFHAKDDCPEVREKFFKVIVNLGFESEFYIARKKEEIFKERHKKDENVFYDDLVINLLKNKLHQADKNFIYFAVRGSKVKQKPLELAIQTAILTFEKETGKKVNSEIKVFPQSPSDEPCLQIIDYMSWAVQRAFIKKEDRYLRFVEKKIKYIADIHDRDNFPNNYYHSKNRFDLNKISPL